MAEHLNIAGLPCWAGSSAAPPAGFEPGSAFWRSLDGLVPVDGLAANLDQLLAGGPAPRTWLLLHEPGQAAVGAVGSLQLARALCARGQNVLVLDVDEDAADLTAWAGRAETEGWIDVARFGASVHGAGAALPFRGGRGTLLGVGSFRPTDVSEDEIISLLARLRHQADDIVLSGAVCPAVVPWARRTERRLFCWDRAVRDEDGLGSVLAVLAGEGVPLAGLLAWGGAPAAVRQSVQAQPAAVRQSVAATPAAPVPPEPAPSPGEAVAEPDPLATPVVPVAAAMPPQDTDGAAGAPGRSPAPAAPALDELAPLDGEPEPARGSPRVFWVAAAVFGLALAAVAWYWSAYVRVPPGGYFEPVATHTVPEGQGTQPAAGPAAGQGVESAPTAAAGDEAGPAPGAGERVSEAGGLASIGDTLPSDAGGAAGSQPAAAGPTTAVTGDSGALPGSAGATAPFDRAPYTVPVGREGWALHVYSLADSASAARQVADLERAGIRAAVRIVEIREKGGRWWRVYVGSFPSRGAADAAMPALLGRLGADWAEPARIQETNP